MYLALYRKWRPLSFDDVVGQGHITVTLKNEVSAGKPSHAYLFCGTRGTGKTTCAKILAKAVNCPDQKGGNPCGVCDICAGIDSGAVLDVTEIDAATNNGVDNIRDLREEAFYTPVMCRYRVYIIDEPHMLSAGAWGALLKIMEEPPAHVIFILATTEIHKVPATVLSRCQRFDFRRIPSGVIADRLLHIAANEDFTLEEDAAQLIARLSDGGMRDAISLLDLCVSANSGVTAQSVRESAGLVGQEYLFEIGDAVESSDTGGLFAVLERLWGSSADYQRLCEQLIGYYRNLMIAKTIPDPSDHIGCLPDELERYRQSGARMDMPRIMQCLDILQDALVRMSRVTARRTELEMALLKLCSSKGEKEKQHDDTRGIISAVIKRVTALEKQGASTQAAKPAAAREPAPSSEEIAKAVVEPFGDWEKVMDILKEKNAALYGALDGSAAYVGGGLLLVDAGGHFAKLVRESDYAKQSLRDAALTVTGQKYRLGPYNAEKYEVKQDISAIEHLLVKASELGAAVDVRE